MRGRQDPAAPSRSVPTRSVSSATAAALRAAALKAVAGGTVYRIETDAGDGVYEVHMTKAGGSLVTVKFDKNLKVTKVESGMGAGDPAPPTKPRRAPPRELADVPSGRPRFRTNAGRGAAGPRCRVDASRIRAPPEPSERPRRVRSPIPPQRSEVCQVPTRTNLSYLTL
jgi:hypothetical protein